MPDKSKGRRDVRSPIASGNYSLTLLAVSGDDIIIFILYCKAITILALFELSNTMQEDSFWKL